MAIGFRKISQLKKIQVYLKRNELQMAKLMTRYRLELASDLDELARLLQWLDQVSPATVPTDTWLACKLAIAEGFTNAVNHAHASLPRQTPITVDITTLTQSLEIRIWDCGEFFDLNQKLTELPQQPEFEQETGRGLRLIQKIVNSVDYIRTQNHQNCLVMIKTFA
jgi:serine/threonine-protein kinase RsbW